MPQALIKVNGVDGSNDNVPINTLVQLDNHGIGGEASYLWTIVYQPPGAADALSSTTIHNPTFTPKKEGTYRITLQVNGLASLRNAVIVAVRQVKSALRSMAYFETTEASASSGWADGAGLNALARWVDQGLGRPVFAAAVAAGGSVAVNSLVKLDGLTAIKAGLPGVETLPNAVLADVGNALSYHERLGLVVASADGGAIVNGSIVLVLLTGLHQAVFILAAGASNPVVGDPVYLAAVGTLALTPDVQSPRRVGTVMRTTLLFGNWVTDVWIDAPTLPPRVLDFRQIATPADNATFLQFVCPTPLHFKQGMPGCVGAVVTPPGANATVDIKKGLITTVGSITLSTLGVVGFTSAADVSFNAGDLLSFYVNGLASGFANFTWSLIES